MSDLLQMARPLFSATHSFCCECLHLPGSAGNLAPSFHCQRKIFKTWVILCYEFHFQLSLNSKVISKYICCIITLLQIPVWDFKSWCIQSNNFTVQPMKSRSLSANLLVQHLLSISSNRCKNYLAFCLPSSSYSHTAASLQLVPAYNGHDFLLKARRVFNTVCVVCSPRD